MILINPQPETKPELNVKELGMNLTDKQLGLILEWFGTAQDLAHGQYLKDDDYALARLIFIQLGRRVPKSIWKNKEKP